MDVKNGQRSAIKFCCWLKKSAVHTVKLMHKVYTDEEWLGDLTIFHWHKAFSGGREPTALFPHVGQPLSICTEEMVNTITAVVHEECHVTVLQLVQVLDISKSSVRMILHEELKVRKVAACWVSHFLTRE